MQSVSITGLGVVVLVLEQLAKLVGLELPEGSVGSAVNAVVQVVGFVLLVVGQLRRKDLKLGLVRK